MLQAIVEKVLKYISEEKMDVRKGTWSTKEIEVINDLQLLTAKPVIYLVNLSERDYVRKKNKWLPKMKAWIDEHNPGDLLIPFSVALEERLVPLSDEEQNAELETLGLEVAKAKGLTPGLGKMCVASFDQPVTGQSGRLLTKLLVPSRSTTAGYAALNLIRYFTCGPQEVRAWTVQKGIKAPAAAGVIHSDFEQKVRRDLLTIFRL